MVGGMDAGQRLLRTEEVWQLETVLVYLAIFTNAHKVKPITASHPQPSIVTFIHSQCAELAALIVGRQIMFICH